MSTTSELYAWTPSQAEREITALRSEVEQLKADREAYGLRVAERVREECHAAWAPRPGAEPEIDGVDLSALVKETL